MRGVIQRQWQRDFVIGITEIPLLHWPIYGKTYALLFAVMGTANDANHKRFETDHGNAVLIFCT